MVSEINVIFAEHDSVGEVVSVQLNLFLDY